MGTHSWEDQRASIALLRSSWCGMPVFRFVLLFGLCDGENSREWDLEWVAFPCGRCYRECCIMGEGLTVQY